MKFFDYKVLPFDAAQGRVPGHEIRSFSYEWMAGAWPSKVVFERWDTVANMSVEVVVPYQQWTEYTKKAWPKGGRVCAVILTNGRHVLAESMHMGHDCADSYDKAPILCRDAFYIRTLGGDATLLEIVGTREWAYSARDEAATKKFLYDPWDRDNLTYYVRMIKQGGKLRLDEQERMDAAVAALPAEVSQPILFPRAGA